MEIFKVKREVSPCNHHGSPALPLPNSSKANCADASNWSYHDDVDMESDDDKPQPQGRDDSRDEGGIGRAGVTQDEEMLKLAFYTEP